MSPELFWAGSALIGAGAAISKLADTNMSLGYMPSSAFTLLTTAAAFVWIPLLISGFFLFRWFDPIIAFVLGWVVVLPLVAIAKTGNRTIYQGATVAYCSAGMICVVAMFFVGDAKVLSQSASTQFSFPPWHELQATRPVEGAASTDWQAMDARLDAGECDAAVRVVTVATGIGLVTVGKDHETQAKALSLIKDMEVVLQRSCGLSPDASHRIVQSILRDVASGLTKEASAKR